jgi:hypothetical protein
LTVRTYGLFVIGSWLGLGDVPDSKVFTLLRVGLGLNPLLTLLLERRIGRFLVVRLGLRTGRLFFGILVRFDGWLVFDWGSPGQNSNS